MQLIKYDAMCKAIAECERVDEAKDIHDKAKALEYYFKQSKNHEAEKQAIKVRIRAERRGGQLLKKMTKAKGGGDTTIPADQRSTKATSAKSLKQMGMSKDQSSRFQKMADIPEDKFEQALNTPNVQPSVNAILQSQKPRKPQVRQSDERALWLWGRLRDLNTEGVTPQDIAYLYSECTSTMKKDLKRFAPTIKAIMEKIMEIRA